MRLMNGDAFHKIHANDFHLPQNMLYCESIEVETGANSMNAPFKKKSNAKYRDL